jgi:hypothetical protein
MAGINRMQANYVGHTLMQRKLNIVSIGIAFIVFISGCASPDGDTPIVAYGIAPTSNVSVVRQTLQSYQAGKTTFTDFRKDAGLVTADRQPRPPLYIKPQPADPQKNYMASDGSPWKIYSLMFNARILNGVLFETNTCVVGDTNHPISILIFDGQGKLTRILLYH